MNVFKKMVKIAITTPATIFAFLATLVFLFIMTFSNISYQEFKTNVAVKSNVDVSELKNYLAKSFEIKEVKDYEYALNTMYIDAYVEIIDSYENVIVHTKTRSNISSTKLKVDQFLDAKAKNNLNLLNQTLDLEIIKTPAAKTPQYLAFFGIISFIISGNIVIAILEKIIKKDNLNRIIISPITIRNLIFQIVLGVITILIVYLILVHCIAMLRLNLDFPTIIYYFFTTFLLFLFTTAVSLIVYILTQDVNTVVVAASGFGTLLYMISGSFVPEKYFPTLVVSIRKLSPVYYYQQLNEQFNAVNLMNLIFMIVVMYLVLGIIVKIKKIEA